MALDIGMLALDPRVVQHAKLISTDLAGQLVRHAQPLGMGLEIIPHGLAKKLGHPVGLLASCDKLVVGLQDLLGPCRLGCLETARDC